MENQIFGKLKVIRHAGKNNHGKNVWECQCECGGQTTVTTGNLNSGSVKSCGCSHKDNARIRHAVLLEDMEGRSFGRLSVVKYHGKGDDSVDLWVCKCVCGTEVTISTGHLKYGNTASCGCLLREIRPTINLSHGLSQHRLYSIFHGMRSRCYNGDNPDYPSWGGKGIRICSEWLEDFESFYRWSLNNGYRDDLTIERIRNSGDYSPDNCRWATRQEQSQNRSTVVITPEDVQAIRNDPRPNAEIANDYNVKTYIVYRIKGGMTWDNIN